MKRWMGWAVGAVLMGGLLGSEAGAHTQTLPGCSGLPTAEDWFEDGETINITAADGGQTSTGKAPKQGEGTREKKGNEKYRYAKVTVPQLAAGELRIFTANGPADAVLCHGSTIRARHKATYTAVHDREEKAAIAARKAAAIATAAVETARKTAAAAEMQADDATTENMATEEKAAESKAREGLRTAANALNAAESALNAAAKALDTAELTDAAATARTDAETANEAEAKARMDRIDKDPDPNDANGNSEDEIVNLYNAGADDESTDPASDSAAEALVTAATNLETAAKELEDKVKGDHAGEGFKLRANVKSGDVEFILVTVQPDPKTEPTPPAAPTLAVQFHGAISSDSPGGRITREGTSEVHELTVTAPGLLTVTAKGTATIQGVLRNANTPDAKTGDTASSFTMAVPVPTSTELYELAVISHSRSALSYDLTMEFAVAMSTDGGTGVTIEGAPEWTNTAISTDDDTPPQIAARPYASETVTADRDVFVLKPTSDGLLAISGNAGVKTSSDTTGVLYGPLGEIATATGGGPSDHFGFANIPVKMTNYYAVVVSGTKGQYTLDLAVDTIPTGDTAGSSTTDGEGGFTTERTIAVRASGAPQKIRHRHLITITAPGTLQLESGGNDDMYGTLYGPDGSIVRANDNGGQGRNFRIVAKVTPGLYLLEVEVVSNAQGEDVEGSYSLESNFLRGATIDEPGTGTGTGTGTTTDTTEIERLRTQIADLEADLEACESPVETDETGFLENPPHNGTRSGVGVISGWVCAANEVEVRITTPQGAPRETFQVAYGTSRPDTDGECDHDEDTTGFGMTYNFNHLAEGTYVMRAYADDEQIGSPHTFTVVHLTEFAASGDDRFLRLGADVQERGVCTIEDFPATGTDTDLLWEESTQNFAIKDAG